MRWKREGSGGEDSKEENVHKEKPTKKEKKATPHRRDHALAIRDSGSGIW